MIDIVFIKNNLELVKKATHDKNRSVDFDLLLSLDDRRRSLTLKSDEMRAKRNKVGKLETEKERAHARTLKETLKTIEDELREVTGKFEEVMLTIPNVPHGSVPVGKDSTGNQEIQTWGTPPSFDFPLLDHMDLARKWDLIDFERGAKVGGFRAYFLKNEAAMLELGVLWYTMRKLVAKGFTPLVAPSLVREFTLFGNGQFPWGRDEVYSVPKDELFMAGTAEVPVTAYFSDEVLLEKDLPKKFVAFSPCFRREAGSYGKDTKGIYRVHQFNKVEQVVLSTNDENTSLDILEELLHNSEEVLQDLRLPYRVLLMCTGDMGEPQVKKYDIETWIPSKNAYGETMSDSYMGEFQARRLKVRYRGKDGIVRFCHTLNNTAIASPRILIPILENYQQKDGTIKVPEVLVPFVGKDIIGA